MAFDGSAVYAALGELDDIYGALGPAYVPPGEENVEPRVLEPLAAEALEVVIGTLIPGDEHWPSAVETNAVGYIDRTLELAPSLEPLVRAATGAFTRRMPEGGSEAFGLSSMEPSERVERLRAVERELPLGFQLIKELAYEAYYRHPAVARVIADRTGFRTNVPNDGVGLAQFDEIFTMLPQPEEPLEIRGMDL